ncbi:MAG: IS66 family insertion sequence element accessory protein TnpB [Ferrovum myxofaciens]
MFFAEARVRVFIYGQPVDARKSYDGLYALARNEMKQDPLSGHLFCFINRRANQIKVLWWDRSGFVFGVNAWSREDSSRTGARLAPVKPIGPISNFCWRAWNRSPSGNVFPVCQPLETRAKITRKYTRKSITTD